MTTETKELETEIVEPTVPVEVEGVTPDTKTETAGDTVVTFGDDNANEEKETPNWVKDLRKRNRELNKANTDLQKQISAGKADDATALGAEPTLEDCEYDAEQYRDELRNWDQKKAKIEAAAKTAKDNQAGLQQAYDVRLKEYQDGKTEFEEGSFDDAEGAVKDALSETQQSILIQAFGKSAARLISGLGQDETRLKELASISDNVAFTVAVTRLESAMKISQRKPKTVPETRVGGNTAPTLAGDKNLEKLEADAEKSGDRSAIVAYKRRQRAASN